MRKVSLLALISTLVLSTSSVFAETAIEKEASTNTIVEDIIAEIEEAKEVSTQKLATKETETQKIVVAEKKLQQEAKEELAPAITKKEEVLVTKAVVEDVQETKPATNTSTDKREVSHQITLPTVPEVPEPIQLSVKLVDENGNIISQNLEDVYPKRRKVIFSDRVAPARFDKKKKTENKEVLPGDIKNGRVAAYIQSPLLSLDEVKAKLINAGFTILTTFKVDKKGSVTSVVITNDALKEAAAKNMRGFAGELRVLVDTKNKLVNISNPIYILKAFMQDEYNPKVGEKALADLRAQFSEVKNSTEIVKFLALERYQFMENMPFYHDMKVVKKAKNEELLKKAKKSKKVVYEQKLANGSTVLGVKLGKRTSKFVKKIGYENSGLLPYPVLIENGEAKIMAPQYYIAIMYPKLKMSKFMTIATVPGAITKDIDKIFR